MATIRHPLMSWDVPELTSSVDELLETLENIASFLPSDADPSPQAVHRRR